MPAERVQIIVEATDAASGILRAITGQFGQLGNLIEDLASPAQNWGNIAFTATSLLIEGMNKAITSAAEAETVQVRLGAALRATGRDSEISAESLDKTATSLAHLSAFDDESIKNTYTTLMQFSSIPTGKFDDITRAAMNMTAAMGGDLASNAEQIGRVLETGLIPRSFMFSKALKDQIAAQIKAGDTAGALSSILGELNNRYGGQAAAQIETYAGKVQKLTNDWNDLWEIAGQMPVAQGKGGIDILDDMVLKYQILLKAINDVSSAQDTWSKIPIVGPFVALGRLLPAIRDEFDNAADSIDNEGDQAELARAKNWGLQGSLQGAGTAAAQVATDYKGLISSIQGMQGAVDTWEQAQKDKAAADQQADRDLRAGLITVDQYNAKIAENASTLDAARVAHEQWAKQTVFDFAMAKASADGITDKEGEVLIGIGEGLGLFDQGTAEAMRNANQAFSNLNTEDAQASIKAVNDALVDITGKSWNITLGLIDNTGLVGTSAPSAPSQPQTPIPPMASGGSFIIPPQYGYEGFRMGGVATASAGETVTVTPKGEPTKPNVQNYFYFTVRNDNDMDYYAQEVTRRQTG